VTTTILLRAIQDEAQRQGFDPQAENVQFDCVRVFAAAGPLAKDDGADLAFVSTRLALTGGAMQALIARVAPRLSIVLGQKLAAQAVPILGAVAGAATNYAYTSYYQEIAHVHFGLRRLAIDADLDHDQLVARMLDQMKPFRAA
ncbi:MAG: EcsC family protein, partial [Marinomonas sp.]